MSSPISVADFYTTFQFPTKDTNPVFRDSGSHIQRVNVIRQLPVLFHTDQRECMKRIFPQLNLVLQGDDPELHGEAATSYLQLLAMRLVSPEEFAITFLPSILHYLGKNDRSIFTTWIQMLLDLMAYLPTDLVHRKLYPLAVGMSQLNTPPHNRASAGKLFGRMCWRFDRHMVEKEIVPLMQSLLTDVSSEVRASACRQLHCLASSVSDEIIKTTVFPNLIELARDEEDVVRAEAVEAITNMLPSLKVDVQRTTIVPLILSICQKSEKNIDETTVRLAEVFGSLCIGLDAALTNAQKLTLVKHYCFLATLGTQPGVMKRMTAARAATDADIIRFRAVECRRFSAENFSKMTKFCNSDFLWQKILQTFVELSSDVSARVRKSIASSLHEVSNAAGDRIKVARRVLIELLKDPSEEVLHGLAPNLSYIIDLLCLSGIYVNEQDPARHELATAITTAITTVENSYNWRLLEELYHQMECAVRFLPSSYIYINLVPLMFRKMHIAKARPVQIAAARTQLYYLRYNLKKMQRDKIKARLESEFCHAQSCHRRMLYLNLCDVARTLFSSVYFKTNFMLPLLSLSTDPVPNCRFVVAKHLLQLRPLVAGDEKYEHELDRVTRAMMDAEKDQDVRNVLLQLENPEVQPQLDQQEDRRKFEEERRLSNINNANIIADPPDRSTKLEPPVVRKSLNLPSYRFTTGTTVESGKKSDSPSSPGSTISETRSRGRGGGTLDLPKQNGGRGGRGGRGGQSTPNPRQLSGRGSSSDSSQHSKGRGNNPDKNPTRGRRVFDSIRRKTNHQMTNRCCTCMTSRSFGRRSKPSLNMEISWLNLETELRQELVALAAEASSRRKCGCLALTSSPNSTFSAAFERDFYRDTGVHVVEVMARRTSPLPKHQRTVETPKPHYLALTARSKSFILPTTTISDESMQHKPSTRIPVSGGRSLAHRRSLDVGHLARMAESRGRGYATIGNNGSNGSIGISRLPVRKGK